MELTTTLNKIQMRNPCSNGWRKLLKYLGKTVADDESLPFSVILDSNGLDDALWCCHTAPEHNRVWRLYAVWCARQVQYLMTDQRSLNALDVAERHANGQATDKELSAAWAAAKDAWDDAKDARVAWAAAGAAARVIAGNTAWVAKDAARETAQAVVLVIARTAKDDRTGNCTGRRTGHCTDRKRCRTGNCTGRSSC